jgi:CheY-like chemotaxis protein
MTMAHSEIDDFAKSFVLIVDDDETTRELYKELFELMGFAVVGASSYEDAYRELRACPSIDLMLTDVNLHRDKEHDMSGLDLARDIRMMRPDLPIVGYSGRFSEGDLSGDADNIFYVKRIKGHNTPLDWRADLELWRRAATTYRAKRLSKARDELERLQRKYNMDSYDITLLQEYLPLLIRPDSIETVLQHAGYRSAFIDKGRIAGIPGGGTLSVSFPIPIWLRTGADDVTAELTRFPDVCATASEEQIAVERLLVVIATKYREFSAAEHTNEEDELFKYLQVVLGA